MTTVLKLVRCETASCDPINSFAEGVNELTLYILVTPKCALWQTVKLCFNDARYGISSGNQGVQGLLRHNLSSEKENIVINIITCLPNGASLDSAVR